MSTRQFFKIGALAAATFVFAKCSKDNTGFSDTLYDKPLPTIQSYIQGKWQCLYARGSVSNSVTTYTNFYWTFANGGIKQALGTNVLADTTINWVKGPAMLTSSDSTFLMTFTNRQGRANAYVVDRMLNDTLILHDNSTDPAFYRLFKSK